MLSKIKKHQKQGNKKLNYLNFTIKMENILPGENRYCLQQNEENDWHLFPATKTITNCQLLNANKSICKEVEYDRSKSSISENCKSDKQMRMICAVKGRIVCGVCLSHLYQTLTAEEEKQFTE